MNIRKNIDYTEMYEALDKLMSQQLSQMELYWKIGKAVCQRTEKGAAVMASEYLNKHYPDVKGFSPRSIRRIREFYRTYENHPALLSRAMKLGWTQNVVIMEADLTMELREWYVRAALQFGWSKTELTARIADQAHLEIVLDIEEEVCDNDHNKESIIRTAEIAGVYFTWQLVQRCCRSKAKRGGLPWTTNRLWYRFHRYRLRLRYDDCSVDLYSAGEYGRIPSIERRERADVFFEESIIC